MEILHRIQHPEETVADTQESMIDVQAEKLAKDVRKTEEKVSFEEACARYVAPDMSGKKDTPELDDTECV